MFLNRDDETNEDEAEKEEVEEVAEEVDEDEAAARENVDEEETAVEEVEDANAEGQQTIVVHEGSTISPWVLALFLPLLLPSGAVLFPVLQAAVTTTTFLILVATRLVSKTMGIVFDILTSDALNTRRIVTQ